MSRDATLPPTRAAVLDEIVRAAAAAFGEVGYRAATLEAWMEGAQEHPGSWWPHYAQWLAKYSGKMVPAREPGARRGTIEDAPGSYVKTKA